jgi:hypothetical protein
MRRWLVGVALAVAACGGGSSAQKAQDLEQFQGGQFAGEELCERAVDNFEKAEQESTSPEARPPLFAQADYKRLHRDRVIRCTRLTQRQAQCIATAASMQYIENCERFAELQ